MEKHPTVYILTNKPFGTLYIGATSHLAARVWQHREGLVNGFTKRHSVHHLVYFEVYQTMLDAFAREKQLKKWRREWKVGLIVSKNPTWIDLWDHIH